MEWIAKIKITQQTIELLLNKILNNNRDKILNVRGCGMFWLYNLMKIIRFSLYYLYS
jgi:hypothetical protein